MILLRSLAFHTAFYLWTTVLALAGLPVLVMGRQKVQVFAKFWTGSSVWLLEKICKTRIVWRGLENLPRGACIIASKHQSALETLALSTKGADFSYILKRELMAIPVFGWYLKGAGQVAIDRAKRGQALPDLTRQVREAIAQGRQMIIFPEGTRTTRAPINPLVGSVALIAKHAKAPVQTLIIDTDSPYLSKGWPLFKRPSLPITYRVRLGKRFAPPQDVAAFTAELDAYYRRELANALQSSWLQVETHA